MNLIKNNIKSILFHKVVFFNSTFYFDQMANQAAKKLKQSNEKFLKTMMIALGVVNVVYLLLSLPSMLWWDSFTYFNWAGWFFALGSCIGCYFILLTSSRCTYDDKNKLISAGEDLRGGGLLTYIVDIFGVICAIQLLSCFHNYAWGLLLVVRYLLR